MTYNKNIFVLCLIMLCCASGLSVNAEKIPVRIAPLQAISTHHDEVETGDWIKFEIADDVYENDKIYIKRNTEVTGIVDFVHSNGWGGDCAQIYFKKFYTTDVNDKKVEINYPIEINGRTEMANASRDVPERTLQYVPYFFSYGRFVAIGLRYMPFVVRGAEILVEPDTKTYNLFIEQL